MPSREPTSSLLDHLTSIEAQTVLTRLLEAHPDMRFEAEQIARVALGEVSFEGVAEEVEDQLRALEPGDLGARVGRHELGYTEPGEAAWQLMEEELGPFLTEMQRHIDLGFDAVALEIFKGVLLGLYRLKGVDDWEFGNWAPDGLVELAGWTVDLWQQGFAERKNSEKGRPALPREFISAHLADWDSWLLRKKQ